jgi:hypothetical protein
MASRFSLALGDLAVKPTEDAHRTVSNYSEDL